MNSSRQKLNNLWLWIAAIAGLLVGGLCGSLVVAAVVFGVLYLMLIAKGHVRFNSRGGGRGRRP